MTDEGSPNAFEWAELVVCLLLVGVGLTSFVLALVKDAPELGAREYRGILEKAGAKGGPPDEILLAGTGVEDVVIEGMPWVLGHVDGRFYRMVPNDVPPKVKRRHYWVLGLSGKLPEPPENYHRELLVEDEGLVVESWTSQEDQGYRLLDHLGEVRAAFVRSESDDDREVRVCRRVRFGPLGRMHCGPNSWNWVGPEEVIIAGAPHWCIWAHPWSKHDLHITFPRVPLSRPLSGRYGLSDEAVETPHGTPVNFRVLVDGKEVINRLSPNRRGFHQYRIPESGGDAELTYVVSAPSDGRRHFCFDGEIKSPPKAKR